MVIFGGQTDQPTDRQTDRQIDLDIKASSQSLKINKNWSDANPAHSPSGAEIFTFSPPDNCTYSTPKRDYHKKFQNGQGRVSF